MDGKVRVRVIPLAAYESHMKLPMAMFLVSGSHSPPGGESYDEAMESAITARIEREFERATSP